MIASSPSKDAHKPSPVLGYPVVPLVFILVAAWLVVDTIQTSPAESSVGLALNALGAPVCFYFKRGRSADVMEL